MRKSRTRIAAMVAATMLVASPVVAAPQSPAQSTIADLSNEQHRNNLSGQFNQTFWQSAEPVLSLAAIGLIGLSSLPAIVLDVLSSG